MDTLLHRPAHPRELTLRHSLVRGVPDLACRPAAVMGEMNGDMGHVIDPPQSSTKIIEEEYDMDMEGYTGGIVDTRFRGSPVYDAAAAADETRGCRRESTGKILLDPRPNRVAAYARGGAGRGHRALEAQFQACRRAVMDLVASPGRLRRFSDLSHSNAAVARPGLAAMLEAARSREFEVLVIVTPDHISRCASELESIWTELTGLEIVVASVFGGRMRTQDVILRGLQANARRAARISGPKPKS